MFVGRMFETGDPVLVMPMRLLGRVGSPVEGPSGSDEQGQGGNAGQQLIDDHR